MTEPVALLLTDLVDSAELAERLGDERMAGLWAAHDRLARDLLRDWRGREIDKTDGFLLLFAQARDALGYVLAYHRALATLPHAMKARAGLHVGQVSLRETPAADVALGAKPIEVDGVSKPIAARVMSTALGGQTLVTAATVAALGTIAQRVQSHGHWRVKGMAHPIEIFEVGDDDAPFTPPPDAPKVHRVVQRGELWLPVREVRHTLPAERDAFVGRKTVLDDIGQRFDHGARLVCLLGIGGGGKTRLATRYGWTRLGEFPGGVWFCDLAPARSADGVLHAVALGLELPLGRDNPVEQIGHAIAGRGECLVILDNFEQVARHAEETVGQWLDKAHQARFLVTSREVLGIAGEQAIALAPLPVQDAQALFERRAAAAKREFAPTPEDQAAIAPLVRLLDGLPLAIELAAARVRVMSPRALLARMSERFKLLSSSGGRHDRQATLRATFDWSWDLLAPADKSALAQLSVFEGGLTLEAAEAVVDLSELDDAPWTVDVVHSLVDKSFLRALDDERFELLVSVQAYAAEHLQTPGRYPGSGASALEAARGRHGAWYAGLGPRRAVARGCADLDNLVCACRRAMQTGDTGTAVGALEGAWAALSLNGPFHAGVALARDVVAMPGLQGSAQARAQSVLGSTLAATGERKQATQAYELAMPLARAAGDAQVQAEVLIKLGSQAMHEGRIDQARAWLGEALLRTQERGLRMVEFSARVVLGNLEHQLGAPEASHQHYALALAIARAEGERRSEGTVILNLANLFSSAGRMDEAREQCEAALSIAREFGDRQREGNALCNLGEVHRVQGRLEDAARASEAALVVARELGHAELECIVLCNLALVDEASGRLPAARRRYDAAVQTAQRAGDHMREGQFLGYLGLLHARDGAIDEARGCLDSGEALLRENADRIGLGVLLCGRAECESIAGNEAAAEAALLEAQAISEQLQAGDESELGQALARVRARRPATGA